MMVDYTQDFDEMEERKGMSQSIKEDPKNADKQTLTEKDMIRIRKESEESLNYRKLLEKEKKNGPGFSLKEPETPKLVVLSIIGFVALTVLFYALFSLASTLLFK